MNGIEIIPPQANFFRKCYSEGLTDTLFQGFPRGGQCPPLASPRGGINFSRGGNAPPPLGGAVKYPASKLCVSPVPAGLVGRRALTADGLSRYDTSFAVMGPKLWNCVPNNLNTMVQFELFKKNLTAFLLSVPDTPPTKGYSPSNSNSILAWRVDSSAAALWGGQRS